MGICSRFPNTTSSGQDVFCLPSLFCRWALHHQDLLLSPLPPQADLSALPRSLTGRQGMHSARACCVPGMAHHSGSRFRCSGRGLSKSGGVSGGGGHDGSGAGKCFETVKERVWGGRWWKERSKRGARRQGRVGFGAREQWGAVLSARLKECSFSCACLVLMPSTANIGAKPHVSHEHPATYQLP